MTFPRHGPPFTIVIKLGTSSIVDETSHEPLLSTLSAVVEVAILLRQKGHKVVLVSSGAIGVGLNRMDLPARPKSLAGKQALAAIGQGRLIALWDNLFGLRRQPIAQVLLTRGDISDRTRYLNAVNTLKELLSMGVVPIVNENDTISVSEIKFGDNDTLSAITSSMIQADYLFLLTDVDGLYTSNPRKDPSAKAIEVVSSIAAIRSQVSTTTLGSSLGTGGMETKLIAAEIATAAGVTTVITSSKQPHNVFQIIEYHITNPADISVTVQESLASTTSSISTPDISRLSRPRHTVFVPSVLPMPDLKMWTSHTLHPAGSVIIDTGAHHVLSTRESGGRLLPVGVLGVIGAFASGQAVRIVIRRRDQGAPPEDAVAARASYARGFTPSQPSTPPPFATAGLITPPDPSSRSTPEPEDFIKHPQPSHRQGQVLNEPTGESDQDVVEVGRGLANYNSAQIQKVKGLNSSHLPRLLKYVDSEYVVENITIRVPP